ncbi:MAG TPA: PQQ-dependent dehydrogenase, methanol/ethanol family [Vicinamibacterales bacterium]
MRALLPIVLAMLTPGLALRGSPSGASDPHDGRREYEARCASCHGLDGAGGGHGPSILDLRRPRATTREALRDLIRNGIPEAGMPGFPLPDAELDALAAYVAVLRSPAADHPVAGNVKAGAAFFHGAGGCLRCHTVGGAGGFLGPDLSNLAKERKLAQLEASLASHGNPARSAREQAGRAPRRPVRIALRDGRSLPGLTQYETPFDIGLLGVDGAYHSLRRSDIVSLDVDRSIVPPIDVTPELRRDLLAYLTRLTGDRSPETTRAEPTETGKGIPFEAIARPRPGEWPTYNGHLNGNRHSPLSQINRHNVRQLAPAWTFPAVARSGGGRALQTTPIVVDGLMYVTGANAAWALDARTGQQVWHYSRPLTKGVIGDAGSGINRGAAILGDRIFMVTDDAHLIALHRLTGHLLWDVEMADHREHYGSTVAPLVVDDLVIAGVSGGDEGVRGFLDAYRAATGERVWRFWTIPAPGEPGSETWGGQAIEHGCGATWLTGTYDPEARLLYWPTGNPCPDYNGAERKGDNLYTNSVLALEPDTGRLRWYYQFTPHDLHDWDATQTPVLVDAEFRGRPRKLLVQGNRNGFFYVLDRITGELLLAEPFVKQLTWASGIGKDGRPQLLPDQEPTPLGTRVCPSVEGATNWISTSFNPATGLFYLMAEEACSIYTSSPEWFAPGESFYGGGTRRSLEDEGGKFLRALDLQTGRVRWEIPVEGGILESGLMTTAGGLVFYGDGSGAFVAADAATGERLWHFQAGPRWKAGPMTYMIDGKQYVAIAGGNMILAFTRKD